MKSIIYYFTGTGNSLAVARQIAAILGDCGLVPIASLKDIPKDIVPQAERIGIICPVYFAGLPAAVASFAGRLDTSHVSQVFSVVTFGGAGESSTLEQLDRILKGRSGRGLDCGFAVKMPGNYILMYDSLSEEKRDTILTAADDTIARIGQEILLGTKRDLPHSLVQNLIHSLMYSRFISGVHEKDRKFSVSDTCTACGTCVEICPAHNIELVAGKPVWKHHCELCCGCIHLCPVQAIQAGHSTQKRQRYRNPSVSVTDLKGNRG